MSARTAMWLALTLWALFLALSTFALLLAYANETSTFLVDLLGALVLLSFATVGALVASRRHDNLIGWLFCVVALAIVLRDFAKSYATYALVTQPGSLPGGVPMAWLSSWPQDIGFGLMFTFLPLLFPTGRLPSRRWRPVAWLAAGLIVLTAVAHAFRPGPLSTVPSIDNPLGTESDAAALNLLTASFLPLVLVVALCSASVIVRFRHAKGEERQQLKWFAYAALFAVSIVIQFDTDLGIPLPIAIPKAVSQVLVDLAVVTLPIAVGIAILKYRLYDIDLLINRTLVFGALSAMLALVYSGSVVLLQALLQPLTRAGGELAIAAATLTIAALFQPLRRRIQLFIDRRFYRSKYDAAKTLAQFGETVRDEVDLSRLSDRLVEVVDETMQPAHVSLWLAQPPLARRD